MTVAFRKQNFRAYNHVGEAILSLIRNLFRVACAFIGRNGFLCDGFILIGLGISRCGCCLVFCFSRKLFFRIYVAVCSLADKIISCSFIFGRLMATCYLSILNCHLRIIALCLKFHYRSLIVNTTHY